MKGSSWQMGKRVTHRRKPELGIGTIQDLAAREPYVRWDSPRCWMCCNWDDLDEVGASGRTEGP